MSRSAYSQRGPRKNWTSAPVMTPAEEAFEFERMIKEQQLISQGLLPWDFTGYSVEEMQAEVLRKQRLDRERLALRGFGTGESAAAGPRRGTVACGVPPAT